MFNAAIKWLKYCRYGVKHYQSINIFMQGIINLQISDLLNCP